MYWRMRPRHPTCQFLLILLSVFKCNPCPEKYQPLIVIDMQQGMSMPAAGPRNNPSAERNIAALLAAWRKAAATLVHVRHISRTVGSPFWPGQPGVEFQAMLAPLASEHVVEKNVPDALVNTGLERWLRVRGITKLVIVGVSANNSVEATARTAGNLGFETQVVADATFAFDKWTIPERSAQRQRCTQWRLQTSTVNTQPS
jgi:nicotinamidase-related amidase